MRVYIAGPYSHKTAEERERNIAQAREAIAALIKAGHIPFCSYAMCEGMEHTHPEISYEDWLKLDFLWIDGWASAVLFLPGWWNSTGARLERDRVRCLPCYYWENGLPAALAGEE